MIPIPDSVEEEEEDHQIWDNEDLERRDLISKIENKDKLTQWATLYKYRFETFPENE